MSITRRAMNKVLFIPARPVGWLAGLPVAALSAANPRPVVIGISLEPNSLDPTTSAAAAIGEVVHYNVLEGLTKIEENGSTRPLLARAWTLSPDGLTATFQLRKDARFHDGSPLDSASVKFSFDRARSPGSTNKSKKMFFDNIDRIDTPDPHTVVLTLHHPDGNLLFRLGENTAVILHPKTADQATEHPVGTGPYTVQEWIKGWGVTLTRWPDFRDVAKVAIPKAVIRFIGDAQVQADAVTKGDVDMLFNIAPQNVARFRANSQYQMVTGASNGKGMLAINNRRRPLNDVRVRRAITHAIDRESYIRHMLDGRGKAIGSHYSPTEPGYVHLAGLYPYDPERGRALLKEAGVRTPLELTLTMPPTPYTRSDKDLLSESLGQIGIRLKAVHVTWPQWLEGPFQGDFELTMINHVEPLDYPIYADPDYYFGYDSPAFRDLVQRHAASQNARERQLLLGNIQRHLAHDAVNAWIFASQISAVARKGLKGWWMNYPIFAHDIAAMSWE